MSFTKSLITPPDLSIRKTFFLLGALGADLDQDILNDQNRFAVPMVARWVKEQALSTER